MILFPQSAEHTTKHATLKDQLRVICGQIEALAGRPQRGSNSVEIVAELNRDWLTTHLLDEDMQMRPYLLLRPRTFVPTDFMGSSGGVSAHDRSSIAVASQAQMAGAVFGSSTTCRPTTGHNTRNRV